MAHAAPIDPMAEARVRWQRSAGADKRTFDEVRQSIEHELDKYVAMVNGVLSDPELTVEPEKHTHGPDSDTSPPAGVIQSKRVVLRHEALFLSAAARIRERLYHPDVDLAGILRCLDFMMMVVNTLGGRLEAPARKGNRSTLGSRKGGKTTKDDRALAKSQSDEMIQKLVAKIQEDRPRVKSARSLAPLVARRWPINSATTKLSGETIRKRIIHLGLAKGRARSPKPKKMGRVGAG
jgi:hypothetical protein